MGVDPIERESVASPSDSATSPPDRSRPFRPPISRGRVTVVGSMIGSATVLLVVGIFSVWANRLLFSPANWSNTSSQLLASPTIRSSAANYAVDQVYANVDVAGLLSSGLPPRLQPLASPAAGALRNLAVQGAEAALTDPRVQTLWAKANYAADQAFIAIVNGGKGKVSIDQGVVKLDLASIVEDLASRLGLPSGLGSKLPAGIANLTVFKSNQLRFVEDAGNATRHLALWLTILVPVLYALAILLARGLRRRALMTVGFAAVAGGLVVILGRSVLIAQVTSSLTSDASLRPAVSEVVSISTQMLHQIAAAVVMIGIPLIAAAWFAGSAQPFRATRRAIAPSLREHQVGWYLATFAVMMLIFVWDPIHATGTPAGIITFTLLALFGTFVLRRQTIEEFPDARLGDASARIRARFEAMRAWRARSKVASAAGNGTLTQQLEELSNLREDGAITRDEYRVAKARLLHG